MENTMEFRKVSLIFVGFVAILAVKNGLAAERPLACMSLGRSNIGKAIGVRLYKGHGETLTATIDEVTMFHFAVVGFNPVPLKIIEVKKTVSHFGDNYRGDGFTLDTIDFEFPSRPHDSAGRLLLDIGGNQINRIAEIAEDYSSGYCEQ
jgi:hypothetical protein